MTSSATPTPNARLQRRTVGVLAAANAVGGMGVSAAIAAGGLLVADVSGSDAASGLAQTSIILGGAVLAVPLARLSSHRGRRWGMASGYALGGLGALIVVGSASAGSVLTLLAGLVVFGAAVAVGMQARFAATDLAEPDHVARDLSLVLWMTAVGAVVGPNLVDPAAGLADAVGLPGLAGAFLISTGAFATSAAIVLLGLRPDPLLVARADAAAASAATSDPSGFDVPQPGTRDALRAVRRSPDAVLGLAAVTAAHAAMIGLMVMTPLHLDGGGASLTVVGIVISVHVAGMYFFAPVMGALADRLGTYAVIGAGASTMVVSGLLAAAVPASSSLLVGSALFLLGLGWSACLVAGSALLTSAMPVPLRPSAQGLTDLTMGAAGAAAGALAGLVFGLFSFAVLGALVAGIIAPVVVASSMTTRREAPDTRQR